MPESWHSILGAWLGTYLLHSTLLLSGAWLATTCFKALGDDLKEAIWKSALVGGLLTASLQVGLGLAPIAGSLRVPGLAEPQAASTEPATDEQAGRSLDPSDVESVPAHVRRDWLGELHEAGDVLVPQQHLDSAPLGEELFLADQQPDAMAETTLHPFGIAGEGDPSNALDRLEEKGGRPGLVAWYKRFGLRSIMGWFAVASGIIALGVSIAGRGRFKARLSGRTDILDGRLPELLRDLRSRAGVRRRVRLTCTDRIATPIAFGILRWEICLPVRAIEDLDPHRQETLLAHELAHLVRRDPVWLALMRMMETLLLLQPLNRIARRRLQELAELAADAWAVEQTGRSVMLARCLADVAAWMVRPGRRCDTDEYAIAMTSSESALKRRVTRLLSTDGRRPRMRLNRWAALPATAVIGLAAIILPGVTGASGPAPSNDDTALQAVPAELRPMLEEMTALEESMAALEAEIDELRPLVASLPGGDELAELIARLDEQLTRLGRRRDLLRDWLQFDLVNPKTDPADGESAAGDGPHPHPAEVEWTNDH